MCLSAQNASYRSARAALSPELQKVLEVLVNDMLRDPSVLSGFAEIVEKILISPGSHQS